MRLVFAAALLVTAGAASLGTEKCTWGPSYWCSSVPAASSCGTFVQCLNTQWRRQIDVDQTNVCKFSQKMVKTIRNVFALENGQDQAKHLLASTCSYIRDPSKRKECKLLVSKFLPQVFKLIQTDLEPENVAVALGFCKELSESDEAIESNHVPVAYAPPTNDTMCQDCRDFVGDLRTLIQEPGSKGRFLNVMENICSDFGPLDLLCKSFVDSAMPNIFDYMAENDNPETVCRVGTFCLQTEKVKWHELFQKTAQKWNKSMKQLEIQISEEQEEIACGDCRKTLTSVLSFEKDSNFRVSVERAFSYVCSLTTVGEEKCHALSETLPRDLAAFVTRHVRDADSICMETVRCTPDEEPVEAGAPSIPVNDCEDCEKFFSDVKAVLENHDSPPEAAALAQQMICQSVGALEFQCNTIMEKTMPTILHLLAQEDTPPQICGALTICPKRADTWKFDIVKVFGAEQDEESLGDFKCDECAVLVQDARDLDRNPDVQKGIETFLNKICEQLDQKTQQQCKDLVTQYSPQLFEVIASELEPELVCELLLHCTKPEQAQDDLPAATVAPPETVALEPTEPTPARFFKKSKQNSAIYRQTQHEIKTQEPEKYKAGESVQCAVCKLAMEILDGRIAANATEVTLERELEGLCKLLPSTVKEPCDEFVQQYTPAVLDLLLQELDPLVVCDELEICVNGTETRGYTLTHPGPGPEGNEPEVGAIEELVEEPASSVECQICQLVVGTVDSLIGQNRTEAAIQHFLDDICNILPDAIRDQCTSFVDEYASVVVQLLLQELDPDQVCVEIGLCDKFAEPQEELDVMEDSKVEAGNRTCEICEVIVQGLDQMLGDNKTEPAIEHALNKVCNLFPDTISAECQSFVAAYAPAIVNLLIQEFSPERICKEIGACQGVRVQMELPHTEEAVPDDDLECDVCHAIIEGINSILGDDRSEKAIIQAVEQVCDVVSGDLKIQCKNEIENYGPAVLDLLKHMDDPSTVCAALKVCPATKHSQSAVKEGEACLLCRTLATYAGEALKQQGTVDEVTRLLKDVCGVLPPSLQSECKSLVDEYTPLIIQTLAEKDDPLQVCQAIGLCPSENASIQPHLLGIDACTFGPVFWCASMDNARQCKAVEHCVENYELKP